MKRYSGALLAGILMAGSLAGCARAEFEVRHINVRPTLITAGESLIVSANIVNTGDADGVYTATLTVDGIEVAAKDIAIASDTVKEMSFNLSWENPGSYTVAVGGIRASFTVVAMPSGDEAAVNETDTEPPSEVQATTPSSVALPAAALMLPKQGAVLDNGGTDDLDLLSWHFLWSPSEGASRYHLYVIGANMDAPLIDEYVDSTAYTRLSAQYIDNEHLSNWTWKVRAQIASKWYPWSEVRTFSVEPVNSDLVWTVQGLHEPELKPDQVNDDGMDSSSGCGEYPPTGAGSLFQSFTPSASSLAAVRLRLRVGAEFPSSGYSASVKVRYGTFDGPILAKATIIIPGPLVATILLVPVFDFLPVIELSPGDTYVIEWVTPREGSGVLAWMASTDYSYPEGTAFGCLGFVDHGKDFIFTTYALSSSSR